MIMTNDKYDDAMYTNCTYTITNDHTNYKLGTIKATCNKHNMVKSQKANTRDAYDGRNRTFIHNFLHSPAD